MTPGGVHIPCEVALSKVVLPVCGSRETIKKNTIFEHHITQTHQHEGRTQCSAAPGDDSHSKEDRKACQADVRRSGVTRGGARILSL